MAPKTRRELLLLGLLLIVLAGVLVYNRQSEPAAARAGTPARQPAASPAGTGSGRGPEVELVRLDALARARPEPESAGRNPFRFRPAPAPPPVAAPMPSGPSTPASVDGLPGPVVPAGPPPPPPIMLKFIGLVEQAPMRIKLAVLSDGRNVFYGKEGDTIEGRYRIERIGPESIEMAYLDGRGRQTLRLSGS
jgi:hypothetical protein